MTRVLVVVGTSLFLTGFARVSFGQDPEVLPGSLAPGYARKEPVGLDLSQPPQTDVSSNMVFDATTGALLGSDGFGPSGGGGGSASNRGDEDLDNGRHLPAGGSIDGLDTVATFDGAFDAQAGSSKGKVFRFTMMGNHPLAGGTTVIPAKISEVSLRLLNADGSVFKIVSFQPFEDLTLDSPNFEESDYSSGRRIQYADAVHRAQFFSRQGENWHTTLRPQIVNRITITVPRFVNVQLANGTIVQARAYFTGQAKDGSTSVLMFNALFNFFFDNEVVNEINLGNFTTTSLNMLLFPNTFLFSLNVNNPNVPGPCCVLGFHTYFFSPNAVPQPRWVTQYASWISPGLFPGGIQDVTALSHETSEAFADPFVDNVTPSWQFPGVPANAKVCQSNLEEGDPIEVLPAAAIPITVRERNEVFTYHPQNIPLLQWFEMGTKSNAIDGAFSFPNESLLLHSALPCPQ